MKKELNEIIKKYELEKTKEEKDGYFLNTCYDYKIYLENLKTNWYIKFENKTRKCKFYSIYTRFDNINSFKEIGKMFKINEHSGKFNHYVYNLQEIENIINNVVMANKLKKAV